MQTKHRVAYEISQPRKAIASENKKVIMADETLATKAPESDAVEQSAFKGDSTAQEGPSMGVSHLEVTVYGMRIDIEK